MKEDEKKPQERDFLAEMKALKQAFPEVDALPDAVAQAWMEGENLVECYRKYLQMQQVLRQNAMSEARAPVRGSTDSPASGKGKDDFLRGLESDRW